MRKKDRTLNVFSVSALDLFASAMGTFILIAIVLFPYYLKEETAQAQLKQNAAKIEKIEKRAAQAKAAVEKARREAARAKAEAKKAKEEAAKARKRAGGVMQAPKPGAPRTLKFAAGCWRTDPFKHSPAHVPGISQYCFDENGRGNMIFYREANAETCGSFATIRREGEGFRIDDSDSRCVRAGRDAGAWYADHLICRTDAGGIIICQGESKIGGKVDRWRVRLHRQ
ncbi:MAG: hypothetical protein ACTSUD_11670 [Alphaproteobacteria bacterium]